MIDRLYVHNFRCLENFTLDLSGRPSTLLIGRNGSGKSTLRRALALFQRIGRGFSRPGPLVNEADFSRRRTDVPMRLAIELTLMGRRLEYAVALEWAPQVHGVVVAEERLAEDGNRIFSRQGEEVRLPAGMTFDLNPYTFALPVINLRAEAAVRDVRAFLAEMVLVTPIPPLMSGFASEPTSELDADAANLADALRALLVKRPAAYAVLDEYLKRVIPDFASVENRERGRDGATQLLVAFEHGTPPRTLGVAFDDLSDGEKCFFLAAYVTALYAAGPGAFCFWDEPDNHLSLAEVGQLVTGLRKAGSRGGGQFVATSHHPEAIRAFTDESTVVLSRASHLDPTVARPLSELPYTGDLVNALIRDEVVGAP